MNTPLMELIEWIDGLIKDQDINNTGLTPCYNSIKNYATELLEKEREVIMDAYWDGGHDRPNHQSTCEAYYTKTFTNESK